MKFFKSVQLFLVAILIIGLVLPNLTQAAVVNSGDLMQINKTVSNNTLVKGETTDVTMTVKGTPKDSTFVKPNDVVLIIDKSGSMSADNRMAAAKDAAKEFIDLMDLTKHELGIVDYQSSANSFALTTDKNAAKAYVDTIQLGGGTNTSAAIAAATSMLSTKRPDAQPTIVIMTDGAADSAPAARAAAQAAKDAGITFYSIALLGPNENPDASAPNQLLKEMASSFDHHHFVLGSVGLSDVYKAIVEEIGLASAYNVTITDTISPEFELVPGSYDNHIPKPTVTGNTIEWFISELKTNELSFTYQVRAKDDATAGKYPVAKTSTTFEMGDSSIYSLNTTNPVVEIRKELDVFAGDIRDPYGVKEAMKGCSHVLNLAALIAIPYSYHSPDTYVDTNIKGTLNVVQAARELNIEKVVHTSTSEVYGTALYVPIDENHPLQGQSPYSASKIGADQMALSFYKSFDTPVSIIRPFNTYGPRQSARAVIPTIIGQLAAGNTTIKLGAISPTRDFNFVKDTVNGFISVMNSDKSNGEVINIGSNYEVSIGETAEMIADIMNVKLTIETDEQRLRPDKSEVERLWADNEKAKDLLGWQPSYGDKEGFRKGLVETIEWFTDPRNLASYKTDVYNI